MISKMLWQDYKLIRQRMLLKKKFLLTIVHKKVRACVLVVICNLTPRDFHAVTVLPIKGSNSKFKLCCFPPFIVNILICNLSIDISGGDVMVNFFLY